MVRDSGQNQTAGGVLSAQRKATGPHAGVRFGSFPLWLSLLAVVAVAGGLAFFMLKPKTPVKAAGTSNSMVVMTVSTLPAAVKTIHRHLAVSGSISAWDPLAIGAEIAQLRVESVNVDEGSQVKKGQILATLNSRVLRAQLAQQKAHLAADQAMLRKAIQPNRVEDLNTWKAALQQSEASLAQEEANLLRARANAANMKQNANRYGELRKVGAVSQMDAEAKFTDAKTSDADVKAAEKRVEAMRFSLRQAKEKLAMAEKGGRDEDIAISNSTMAETRARIAELEAQIEQTIIRAPADGKIIKRDVHLGEISSIGKTMFTMVRNGRLELKAMVPEVDIPRIKPGMPVRMTATGESTDVVPGKVREVSPSVDEKTRLGIARIDVPAQNGKLKPGLFYHADVDLGKSTALVVPAKAVLSRNEKEVVFVFQDGQAKMRPVTVGEPLSDGAIEIVRGLEPGEPIIISGAGFMKDGDKVRTVPDDDGIKKSEASKHTTPAGKS